MVGSIKEVTYRVKSSEEFSLSQWRNIVSSSFSERYMELRGRRFCGYNMDLQELYEKTGLPGWCFIKEKEDDMGHYNYSNSGRGSLYEEQMFHKEQEYRRNMMRSQYPIPSLSTGGSIVNSHLDALYPPDRSEEKKRINFLGDDFISVSLNQNY